MNGRDKLHCSRFDNGIGCAGRDLVRAPGVVWGGCLVLAHFLLAHFLLVSAAVHAATPAGTSGPGSNSATPCASVSEIPRAECEALKAIYYSLDGPSWSYQEGWLQSNRPCSWVGVRCHGGRVTELSLAFNNLNGVVPGAVGDLQSLTSLNLIHNQIRGLPPELGQLAHLQSLFLSNNNLAALPPEIGALANLRELHLSGNPLTTLPPEIGELHQLRELYLLIDSLWALPPEMAALANLRVLRVSAPLLSEALPDMSRWTHLEVLALSGCNLNVWPAPVEALSNLHTLDLSRNNLVVLPAALGRLTGLRTLDLSANALADVPTEIGQLRSLTVLDLSGNELSTLPAELGALTALQRLDLTANRLAALPATLRALTAIQHELIVDYNRLRTLPEGLERGNLVRTGWQKTQTIPPTDLHVAVLAQNRVQLTWVPISYTMDGGFYEIMHRSGYSATALLAEEDPHSQSGEYEIVGRTPSKQSSAYVVEGLDPTQVHEWALRTYTPAHDLQKNYLWSEPGAAIRQYFTHLALNHSDGQPGTIFAATAGGFPPEAAVDIYANDRLLDTFPTDAAGALHFLLDTGEADEGAYTIAVAADAAGVSARSTAPLTLASESDRHTPPPEAHPVVWVPSGLVPAHNPVRQVYLPTIMR